MSNWLVGRAFVCATILSVASTATHAGAQPKPLDPTRLALLDDYLAGKPDPTDLALNGGATGQTLALLGREDLVMRYPFSHRRPDCAPLESDGIPVDPVSYIADRAAGFRVTMINEAHDMPQNRGFIKEIAKALRARSYTFYGAETFSDSIALNAPPTAYVSDGYFVEEPIFGRLVRSLRTLGYHLFPYEFRGQSVLSFSAEENMSAREAGEGRNLARRLAALGKTAKVLVHVGYSHLDKSPNLRIKMMAGYFRDQSGIDPLTVDQTQYWSSTGSYSICAADHFDTPVATTIYVGIEKPSFTRGRPNWRLKWGDRFVDIPPELRRPNKVAIYEAWLSMEPDTAVPLDRLLVKPGEELPLLLPIGRYRLQVWTEEDGWSGPVLINTN